MVSPQLTSFTLKHEQPIYFSRPKCARLHQRYGQVNTQGNCFFLFLLQNIEGIHNLCSEKKKKHFFLLKISWVCFRNASMYQDHKTTKDSQVNQQITLFALYSIFLKISETVNYILYPLSLNKLLKANKFRDVLWENQHGFEQV